MIYLKKREFSGKLEVKSSAKFSWTFYFYLGRLVGCDGGHHSNRSLKRQLLKYCTSAQLENLELEVDLHQLKALKCHTYHLLISLCNKKIIKREAAAKVIQEQIRDALFDILQQENFGIMNYDIDAKSDNLALNFNLHDALKLVNVEFILKQSHQDWLNWVTAGCEFWSPNFAPKIKSKQSLENVVSPAVYQNLTHCINGQRTLRDLACKMNKDVLLLMRSLAPYIRQGIVDLIEVPDIVFSSCSSIQKQIVASQANNQKRPLVVCIDDSKQVCETMRSILTKANYDFADVNEAIQAVPTLISKKPDLIFLDIGMPIMNGYEVCTQIKRVSQLNNIPVVILTGKDGIIDRMRAKMVGASAFLTKPIEVDKVLSLAEDLIVTELNQDKKMLDTNSDLELNSKVAYA